MKYQKKVLDVFAYQWLWLLLIRTGNDFYRQVFLEECKYVVKGKKMSKYIIDDIVISSDSDEENSAEKHSDEDKWRKL